jgi:hypothetical protein
MLPARDLSNQISKEREPVSGGHHMGSSHTYVSNFSITRFYAFFKIDRYKAI